MPRVSAAAYIKPSQLSPQRRTRRRRRSACLPALASRLDVSSASLARQRSRRLRRPSRVILHPRRERPSLLLHRAPLARRLHLARHLHESHDDDRPAAVTTRAFSLSSSPASRPRAPRARVRRARARRPRRASAGAATTDRSTGRSPGRPRGRASRSAATPRRAREREAAREKTRDRSVREGARRPGRSSER